jgi:glutaminyl-tRNA synthetase
LFNKPAPAGLGDLNPNSLEILANAKIEPNIVENSQGVRYQFERMGYFYRDNKHETDKPIFNRIVTLRDSWAKLDV